MFVFGCKILPFVTRQLIELLSEVNNMPSGTNSVIVTDSC